MTGANNLVRGGLALCLCGALAPLRAQDTGFSKSFKFRLGVAGSQKDHLRAPYSGLGFNVGYGVGRGIVGLELGYIYKTGDDYFTTPDDSRLDPALLPMNPAKAVESKRNEFAGLTVRASYSQPLNAAWRWQAGLQFGGSFKHQYVGDAQSTPWDVASGGKAWRDFYLASERKAKYVPSPYAGVTWRADKDSSVEFNVVLLSYTAMEYHHYVGTASAYDTGAPGRRSASGASWPMDALATRNRMVPHAEVAYVFHF